MEGLITELVKGLGLVLGGGALAEIVRQIFVSGDAKNVDRAKINTELWDRLDSMQDEMDQLRKDYWDLHSKHADCESETKALKTENERLVRRIERIERTQSSLSLGITSPAKGAL
jgi:predicted nuclease with TOPRIM domain